MQCETRFLGCLPKQEVDDFIMVDTTRGLLQHISFYSMSRTGGEKSLFFSSFLFIFCYLCSLDGVLWYACHGLFLDNLLVLCVRFNATAGIVLFFFFSFGQGMG